MKYERAELYLLQNGCLNQLLLHKQSKGNNEMVVILKPRQKYYISFIYYLKGMVFLLFLFKISIFLTVNVY